MISFSQVDYYTLIHAHTHMHTYTHTRTHTHARTHTHTPHDPNMGLNCGRQNVCVRVCKCIPGTLTVRTAIGMPQLKDFALNMRSSSVCDQTDEIHSAYLWVPVVRLL